ncbi:MAG TPA: transglycosylase domain-containing protein, partial [Jatrophihabitans sp.]|nr:transglycosylase domain-containing protein [Jatrophihabitans sp.]
MARASGWTILSKLSQLIGLLVILGVLAAGFLLPYIGGVGLAAKAGADKFLNTQCSLTEEPVQQRTTMYASDGKTVIATLFDQNIDRKIQDAQCALRIERENSKQAILEKYLNIAFFGEGAYGIETAAQTFFGVDAK